MRESLTTPSPTMAGAAQTSWLKRHQLLAFFVLTFVLTWVGWFLALLLPLPSLADGLLFRIAGFGPACAALILTGITAGKQGVRALLGGLLQWRVGLRWYLVVFFSFWLFIPAALALNVLLGGTLPGYALQTPWYKPLLLYLVGWPIGTLLAPPAEEPGWRGFALPRLLNKYNALLASVFLGVIWAIWHFPLFLTPDGGKGYEGLPDFVVFIPFVVALSILIAWVYVNTKGSLLISLLFHGTINTITAYQVLPIQGHDRPAILLTIVLWVAVAIIVATCGPNLRRGAPKMDTPASERS